MGLILQLLVSAVVFIILSKIIPGFEIKNFKTSLLVAIVFGVLMVLCSLLVSPLSFLVGIVAKIVSYIPLIGAPLAKLGSVLVAFLLKFILGAIALGITDKFISGFKMRSFAVGIVAAILLAAISSVVVMF